MFGLGYTEILVILAIALLLFGKQLPSIARTLGKSFIELRKETQKIKDDVGLS